MAIRRIVLGGGALVTKSAGDSWRKSAQRGSLFALITSPWRLSFEKQAHCASGAGHLLAIIKPKIVCHTIIFSANYLFLLALPTSLNGRVANPAVINLSIRSPRSLPSPFRVIFFFGVEHVRCIFL